VNALAISGDKDVAICDKPRVAANSFDPGISEWENPAVLINCYLLLNT